AGIGSGPARVDPHVAADGPAQWHQRLQERPDPGLIIRIVRGCAQKHTDPPHAFGLLRMGREWPRHCRAAYQTDELASSHCLPPRGLRTLIVAVQTYNGKGPTHVRFGSKADICSATDDVRFTPNSDRESELPQTVMSALPPKACLLHHS